MRLLLYFCKLFQKIMCRIANLNKEPFTSYSAENEKDILNHIFYRPSFYNDLKELMKSGHTRFILGQRGHGKSVLIYKLRSDLYRERCLPVVIDSYDDIPLKDNEHFFLYKIVQHITLALAERIADETLSIDKVPNDLKQKFGVLVEMFYDENWASTSMEEMEAVRTKKFWNRVKRLFNFGLKKPLNEAGNIAIEFIGSVIRKTVFGKMDDLSIERKRVELFSGFTISKFRILPLTMADSISVDEYKRILDILIAFVGKTRLESIVVLFDKVDEFSKLNSDIKKISDFMESTLLDTGLLYKIGIVFSLWSSVRYELNKAGVRFDKFPPMDIRWRNKDLIGIINQRLLYYSSDKGSPVTLQSLIPNDALRSQVLYLADRSPRFLLMLLNEIQCQEADEPVNSFSYDAIAAGMIKFCKTFDYLSVRSVRSGSGKDLMDWIAKLLAMNNSRFTIADYMRKLAISSTKIGESHIRRMLDMELIKEDPIPSASGETIYEISDPRITYLISRGVSSLD